MKPEQYTKLLRKIFYVMIVAVIVLSVMAAVSRKDRAQLRQEIEDLKHGHSVYRC